MTTNVPKGSILAPGGTVVAPDPGDPICAAYDAALKDWCATPKDDRGDFNDAVFDKLNDPALAATRERPIGFIGGARAAGGPRGVLGLRNLASQGGYGSRVARRALGVINQMAANPPASANTYSALRHQMSGATRGALRRRFRVHRVLCPDAERPNGRPVEIKRPTEKESHPGQLSNYAKASPDGTVELVNCAACKLACKDWNSDCEGYP
ncbi:hypothetical protein [Sorangium sp. So ce406]|uniref:hypothetical protein n=1 Tax=Sorangium sp. So ce406 TaxID=3133311 RepID=UPI003F5BED8E